LSSGSRPHWPVVVRRYASLETLKTNNEVAGFKFAVVGVLYAVLLAFAVIVVWERFAEAETNVAKEAGAAATIYRLSRGISGEPGIWTPGRVDQLSRGDNFRRLARNGTRPCEPISTEGSGRGLQGTTDIQRDTALVSQILHELDTITEMRRARLAAAEGLVPGVIWPFLFGGAILTIVYTFFFGTENLRAQALMTGMLAAIIFSGLLTVIVIDRPFVGVVKVHPDPLAEVLADFASTPSGH
jgi:Protein of unknown function (DUF4239)